MEGLRAKAAAAMVVAHPGHELLMYGWLESVRPSLFVLTDGSGRSGESSIKQTARLAQKLGIKPGSFFGRYTDRQIYQSLINHDYGLFIGFVDELVAYLTAAEISYMVTDSAEGYNPTHDLCHIIACAAVSIANRNRLIPIDLYEYPVVGNPMNTNDPLNPEAIVNRTSDACFQRKLDAARAFYPALALQVETTLANPNSHITAAAGLTPMADNFTGGLNDLKTECLRPVNTDNLNFNGFAGKPFYETRGEANILAGHYEKVIRLREHISPVVDALRRHASKNIYAWA